MAPRTKHPGIYWIKKYRHYKVMLGTIYLGSFKDLDSARCCRINAVLQLYGLVDQLGVYN